MHSYTYKKCTKGTFSDSSHTLTSPLKSSTVSNTAIYLDLKQVSETGIQLDLVY